LLRPPEMPRVLIAGCGYIGSAAAKLFAEEGWEVIGWTRSAQSAERIGGGTISLGAVDITDLETVRRNAFAVDVVVHCASSGNDSYLHVYHDGAANLAACFPGARIMFTSSTSVYSQRDGSFVTEESAAEPDSANAQILRQAEKIVLDNDGIVLRVAGIYGPGRSFMLRSVMNGTAVISDRLVNQAHRDDVASAIFSLARCRALDPPRIFNVVDDVPASRAEILDWLSARMGVPLSNLPATSETKRGRSNKRVSNAKLRALGWVPAYPNYREGFERSVLPALENCGA
jgi:nucleoside-diphosphate-sugar epimerase